MFSSFSPKTSKGRYLARIEDWIACEPHGSIKHRFWWITHNVIAHIGIGLFPCTKTFRFHDYTSNKLMTHTHWR